MTRFALAAIGLAVASGAFATAASADPSFDCRFARKAAEITICGNDQLESLDREMSHLYYERLEWFRGTKARNLIKRTQKSWLRSRNACGYDAGCIASEYHERIDWLRTFDI